jgi:hypothetical protein
VRWRSLEAVDATAGLAPGPGWPAVARPAVASRRGRPRSGCRGGSCQTRRVLTGGPSRSGRAITPGCARPSAIQLGMDRTAPTRGGAVTSRSEAPPRARLARCAAWPMTRAMAGPILVGYDPRAADRAPVRLGVMLTRLTESRLVAAAVQASARPARARDHAPARAPLRHHVARSGPLARLRAAGRGDPPRARAGCRSWLRRKSPAPAPTRAAARPRVEQLGDRRHLPGSRASGYGTAGTHALA